MPIVMPGSGGWRTAESPSTGVKGRPRPSEPFSTFSANGKISPSGVRPWRNSCPPPSSGRARCRPAGDRDVVRRVERRRVGAGEQHAEPVRAGVELEDLALARARAAARRDHVEHAVAVTRCPRRGRARPRPRRCPAAPWIVSPGAGSRSSMSTQVAAVVGAGAIRVGLRAGRRRSSSSGAAPPAEQPARALGHEAVEARRRGVLGDVRDPGGGIDGGGLVGEPAEALQRARSLAQPFDGTSNT